MKRLLVALVLVLCAVFCYNYFFPFGKYVYLEAYTSYGVECLVCHTERDCKKFTGVMAKRVESEQLESTNTSGWTFCSRCVSDRQYEKMK